MPETLPEGVTLATVRWLAERAADQSRDRPHATSQERLQGAADHDRAQAVLDKLENADGV